MSNSESEGTTSNSRPNVGALGSLIVFAAFSSGLAAQAAQQIDKQAQTPTAAPQSAPVSKGVGAPAAIRAVIDPVTGKLVDADATPASERDNPNRIDPKLVMPAPSSASPASGLPGGVEASGKFGPDGKAIAKNSRKSPHGSRPAVDKATERFGPDGKGGPSAKVSQSAAKTAKLPATKAAPEAKRVSAKAPAAGAGLVVFTDPATGEIVEPTEAQLAEHALSRPANGYREEQLNLRAGPDGSIIADVPAALHPVVEATVGPDGKVNVQHTSSPHSDAVMSGAGHGPQTEQQTGTAAEGSLGHDAKQGAELPSKPKVVVIINNTNAAGVGFNDPTAVAPVFGNPGTTVGAQRLNAFRAAAEYWGGILKSNITIRVNAQMIPQTPCSAGSGILGSAGPVTVHRDFTNRPVANTWYVQAVANSLANADQDPAQADVSATFNSSVGTSGCLTVGWWYGIGAPPPGNQIDFYTVVLHEIGHGIGVLSLVNLGTGAKFNGFNDAYMRWLWDWSVGGWPAMTDAQRVASAVNTGQVIFWGPNATEAGRGFLTSGLSAGYPRVFAPNPVQGGSSISHFDTVTAPNELMEPSLTAPPGPYSLLTTGLLQDVGWKLLVNGVLDFGAYGIGTWTWNPTTGWNQPTSADPTNLEGWNGNFVGLYNGTWLWNGTTEGWTQLTAALPQSMKGCGKNLLWEYSLGTWVWNVDTGWMNPTSANPDSIECFGNNLVWEGSAGTWIYDFAFGWSQITGANPTGVLACGSKLYWWRPGDTWFYDGITGGWANIASVGPESAVCWRNRLVFEYPGGTWLYTPGSGWSGITSANPDSVLAWGPNLVWEDGTYGTWIYSSTGDWAQATAANPLRIEVIGDRLLWTGTGNGTWVWSGGGAGANWDQITTLVSGQMVSATKSVQE